MNKRLAFAAILSLTFAILSRADDKWQPPPAPDGWKYVVGKDGTYEFLFPKEAGRTGTRDRDLRVAGVRTKIQVNYMLLRDDTLLEVHTATLTGPGLSGLKIGDVYDLVIDGEKEEGYTVDTPKDAVLANNKAREYRLSKDKVFRRMIVLVVKNHLYIMNVGAPDAARLDSEKANTFLKSFVFIPKEAQEAASKERAAKAEQSGKESMEKLGFKWTLKLDEMTPPDVPVSGKVRGKDFKPDSVVLEAGGNLKLRQGTEFFADVEVRVVLFLKGQESAENRTFEIKPGRNTGTVPHINLSTKEKSDRVPKTESALSNYAMKLKFGAKDNNGFIPGTIYLCTSDPGRSFIAGKFEAIEK